MRGSGERIFRHLNTAMLDLDPVDSETMPLDLLGRMYAEDLTQRTRSATIWLLTLLIARQAPKTVRVPTAMLPLAESCKDEVARIFNRWLPMSAYGGQSLEEFLGKTNPDPEFYSALSLFRSLSPYRASQVPDTEEQQFTSLVGDLQQICPILHLLTLKPTGPDHYRRALAGLELELSAADESHVLAFINLLAYVEAALRHLPVYNTVSLARADSLFSARAFAHGEALAPGRFTRVLITDTEFQAYGNVLVG